MVPEHTGARRGASAVGPCRPDKPTGSKTPDRGRLSTLPAGPVDLTIGIRPRATGAAMPTIARSGPYRIFFYSSDWAEPVHVHVRRDDAEAKFWLAPVRLERSTGFRRSELLKIRSIIMDRRQELLDAWYEYFR